MRVADIVSTAYSYECLSQWLTHIDKLNCIREPDAKCVLQFELFQQSPTGDLVLGECKMRVADIVATGAVHSWFPFVDASDPTLKAGEVLMAIQAKKGMPTSRGNTSVTTSAVGTHQVRHGQRFCSQKLNEMFLGYSDPSNIILDNTNKWFSGWPNRCIEYNRNTGLFRYNIVATGAVQSHPKNDFNLSF